MIVFASSHRGQTTKFTLVAIPHPPCCGAQPNFKKILLSHDNHDQKTEERSNTGWGDIIHVLVRVKSASLMAFSMRSHA